MDVRDLSHILKDLDIAVIKFMDAKELENPDDPREVLSRYSNRTLRLLYENYIIPGALIYRSYVYVFFFSPPGIKISYKAELFKRPVKNVYQRLKEIDIITEAISEESEMKINALYIEDLGAVYFESEEDISAYTTRSFESIPYRDLKEAIATYVVAIARAFLTRELRGRDFYRREGSIMRAGSGYMAKHIYIKWDPHKSDAKIAYFRVSGDKAKLEAIQEGYLKRKESENKILMDDFGRFLDQEYPYMKLFENYKVYQLRERYPERELYNTKLNEAPPEDEILRVYPICDPDGYMVGKRRAIRIPRAPRILPKSLVHARISDEDPLDYSECVSQG